MAVRSGREKRRALAAGDGRIDIAEEHLEGVGETLDMSGRVVRITGGALAEGWRGAHSRLVRAVAAAKVEHLRIFRTPPRRLLGAVEFDADTVLAACSDLRNSQIAPRTVGKPQQHVGKVLGADLVGGIAHLGVRLRKRLHLAKRALARLVPRLKVGEHLGDLRPQNKRDRIHPVRPDIGHGAQLPALLRQQPPVVVRVLEEPVLHVGAVHVDDLAQLATRDHSVQCQHGGIEANVVIHGKHAVAAPRQLHELGRFTRVHGERLLAHHMLAGAQRGRRHLEVKAVRRGDVDGVDLRAGQQLAIVGERPRNGQPLGGLSHEGILVADGRDGDAQPTQRLDVDRADESGADDACAK